MSTSRHPVALRLERLVGGPTRLLATVMLLPLVDGIFPALVLAGALDSAVGVVQTGLLVFGGSATLAVVLAEMDGDRGRQTRSVLAVGTALVAVAAVEAALAPTIASVLDLAVFERFAGLVVAAVAARTASARVGEYLPRPAVVVGLGALASLQPSGFELVVDADPALVARAAAAGLVGTGFALGVVALQPYLRSVLDVDRFRFGSAVALGVLALSVLGLAPENAPLAVLGVAGLLAFDPGVEGAVAGAGSSGATDAAVTDGGEDATASDTESRDSSVERAPWL